MKISLSITIFIILSINLIAQADNFVFELENNFGGNNTDEAYSIISDTNGDFIIAATTSSKGEGSNDAWIIKLNNNGNIIWDKTFGSSKNEHVYDIIETQDNGYIFVGQKYTSSTNRFDAWAVKIDNNGNLLWEKLYGQTKNDLAKSITTAHDGGFIIAGKTASMGNGLYDAWTIKIDYQGNIVWNKTYGGAQDDVAYDIIQTSDRNYAFVGYTKSSGNGKKDAWIVKIDLQGNLVWEKLLGKAQNDEAYSLIESSENNLIISGYSQNVSTSIKAISAASIDNYGNINWERDFSSGFNSIAYSIVENSDHTYNFVGYTFTDDGKDIWIGQIDNEGNKILEFNINNSGWDNAQSITVLAENQYLLCGTIRNSSSNLDVYFTKINYTIAGQSSYYISDIDENLPQKQPKDNHYALIIGNATYQKIPSLKYSVNDANTFKNYATTTLGVPNDDIHLFYAENVTGNDFKTYVANFQQLIQDKTNSKFFIFYSGHGAQSADSTPYLIPVDLSPDYIETQGFKLQTFINYLTPPPYNNDTVLFFFDACFSSPANSSINKDIVGTRPKTTKTSSNIIIFSASDEHERSQEDSTNFHGLYSYYLFQTIKNSNGNISLINMATSVEQKVHDASLNPRFNQQNPQVKPSNSLGNTWKNWTIY